MSLRATNLNLLPILRALLREGNITRAAVALNLSQPATSNALRRLRVLLGDPLLVQMGRGMVLTPRAERIRAGIDGVCDSIETLLFDAEFEPANADRDFVVATPDYMASLIGPPLLRRLTEVAPRVCVRFIDVSPDFRRGLTTGEIDVGVIAHMEGLERSFRVQAGYMDRLVGVVAADHPLAAKPPLKAEEMRAYPWIGLDLTSQGLRSPSMGDAAYGGPRSQMSAPHLRILPLLVAQSRGVAMMPEALARQAARMLKLASFELPEPAAPLNICMAWSVMLDTEPASLWFRGELDRAMRAHFDRVE